MSLTDEERGIIVELEIEKAYKTFKAVEVLCDAELWSSAANRLYYSLFHAVCALLIHGGHQVSTHRGSRVLFGQHYIKTESCPRNMGPCIIRWRPFERMATTTTATRPRKRNLRIGSLEPDR